MQDQMDQMDETDARATILDLSEFSEAPHRFFDIKYSLKVKYSRIIESFIPCRPNLRQTLFCLVV